MSVQTTQQSLLPIRRDKQIPTGSFSTSGGGASSGGGGTTLQISGGTNICLGTGGTITINVCGTIPISNNSNCLNGHTEDCLSVKCANNSSCLGTYGSAHYAPIDSPNFSMSACAPKFIQNGTCLDSLYQGIGSSVAYASSAGTATNSCHLIGCTMAQLCVCCAQISTNSLCLNGHPQAYYLLSGGTAVCATCASCAHNSDCLNGKTEDCLSVKCANNSSCLGTYDSSHFAPLASPNFTTMACAPKFIENGTCLALIYQAIGGSVDYASSAGMATDSCHLCGCLPNQLCVKNSTCLNGLLAAGYLLSGGTAKNSLCLNGHTEDCLSVKCANNSTCLGTYDSTHFAPLASPSFTTMACAPKFVENGTCLALIYQTIGGSVDYAVCAGTATNSLHLIGCTMAQLCVCCAQISTNSLCVNGHAEATLSVCNAVCVNGHAEANLSVANSACLGGALANTYAPLASPVFTGIPVAPAFALVAGDTFVYDADTINSYGLTLYQDSSMTPVVGTTLAISDYRGIKFFTGNASVMTINGSGLVGIGCVAPSVALDVCGSLKLSCNATALDFTATSDCRLKKDIKPIMGALSTVMQLQGVCYHLCTDEKCEMNIGLIAQDVQKVLPEVVSHSTPDENDKIYGITDERYSLNYDKLSAVLIESIKTLKKEVDGLKLDLNYMRNYNKE